MKPVFIGGCDRSGTTMLGAMLGMHTECLTVPESQFKIDVLRNVNLNEDKANLLSVLNMIKKHPRFRLWSLDIDSTPISEDTSCSQLIEWIVKKYGEKVGKETCRVWVDHTPANIRYGTTLLNLFPEAKMVHIVRDGRAVASSIMRLDWGPNTIIEAARWWVEKVGYGLAAESSWGSQIIRLKYEDLVSEPEHTLKTLCAFLNIDYQASMVAGHGFKVPAYTAKQHVLVGKKPDVKRVNAWKEELTPRQVEIFESLTGDFLSYLGYDLKYGVKARKPTTGERLRSDIRELYKKWVINKFRHRRRVDLIK